MSTKKKNKSADKKLISKDMTVEELKKELAAEQKAKDTIEWSNMELERSVRAMEMNVLQLEAGNLDADDSEAKQRFENQKQLNLQLLEQKRWLEHELEQIKQKIQNEKMEPLPDAFSMDWDNLSETELKRLVGQLEKTRNDLKSDLKEMEFRLDKEGKEFHHHEEFARMYMAEIINLNRILESLIKTGSIPTGFPIPSSVSTSQGGSYVSTGGLPTPGGYMPPLPVVGRKSSSLSPPGKRKVSHPSSPRKLSPTRKLTVVKNGRPDPPDSKSESVMNRLSRKQQQGKNDLQKSKPLPNIEKKSKNQRTEVKFVRIQPPESIQEVSVISAELLTPKEYQTKKLELLERTKMSH